MEYKLETDKDIVSDVATNRSSKEMDYIEDISDSGIEYYIEEPIILQKSWS